MTLRGEAEIERRARYEQRRRKTPAYRAANAAQQRRWYARNKKRHLMASAWASLHSLRCPYPDEGCTCVAVVIL